MRFRGFVCSFFILFAFVFHLAGLNAQEKRLRPIQQKKYKLSVCALIKNEERYLREWIEYHRMVGVDHFYLYDIGCTDRTVDVLRPYVRDRLVTLVNWPIGKYCRDSDPAFVWALSTQVSAYENAAKFRAIKETKWLVCLNVDEFLVPPYVNNLGEILDRYDSCPGIVLPSTFFDASSMNTMPPKNLVIQTTELAAKPAEALERSVKKMIFKPELCEGFKWPPYECCFKNQEKPALVSKSEIRINQYVNRFNGYLQFAKSKRKLYVDNRQLSDEETYDLLVNGYEIDDQERAIERFAPALMKKLGYDTSWKW